jgi:hypothetical protein
MVHALEKVKTWLVQGGYVLIVHDLVDPPRVEIHNRNRQFYAGQLSSDTGFENQRLADQAIDQVIHEGIYTSDQTRIFEYDIRADSLRGMLDLLAESWESAYLTDDTREKVEELVDLMGGDSEVVLHLISRIVKLDLT